MVRAWFSSRHSRAARADGTKMSAMIISVPPKEISHVSCSPPNRGHFQLHPLISLGSTMRWAHFVLEMVLSTAHLAACNAFDHNVTHSVWIHGMYSVQERRRVGEPSDVDDRPRDTYAASPFASAHPSDLGKSV
jgi:hypothetical protein